MDLDVKCYRVLFLSDFCVALKGKLFYYLISYIFELFDDLFCFYNAWRETDFPNSDTVTVKITLNIEE